MYIEDLGEIKAIAFDIDGTLYRNCSLYSHIFFHYFKNLSLFHKFSIVRKEMHSMSEPVPNFLDIQSEKMAARLKCSKEEAFAAINTIAYEGLSKYFKQIKPCNGVVQFVQNIHAHGIKVGILSDFPPEQKGDIWGIRPYCDVILGTEEAGLLKPSSFSFLELAKRLNVKPEEILYIGNNHKYDVEGGQNAGMKTAWFISPLLGFLGKKSKKADITFWSYKKLNKQLF